MLWSGNTPIEGSLESVDKLRAAGKNVIFVTNVPPFCRLHVSLSCAHLQNATKTRKTYSEKFSRLGLEVDQHFINTAGSAAADYCATSGFKKVFAIGHEGMFEELQMRGLDVLREEGCQGMDDDAFVSAELAEGVDAVVVGWDKDFSMRKLCLASLYLQQGAEFVVTNPDSADRMAGNRMQPGTGCFQAAIAFSVGLPAEKITVCGKPNQGFLEQLLSKYNFAHPRTIMCGDRLDTDIAFGGGKIDTLLVLRSAPCMSVHCDNHVVSFDGLSS